MDITKRRKILFFIILILTALPPLLFSFFSDFYHEIFDIPAIEKGVLDLNGYDLENSRSIPLDGKWEFYWKKWIVTDKIENAKPDIAEAEVPRTWTRYTIHGEELPNGGYASYRILLKNCPRNVKIMSYVPNIGTAYRVYLDGMLVADSGKMSKDPAVGSVSLGLERGQTVFASKPEVELVIEVSSSHIGGLYLAPILAESGADNTSARLRDILIPFYMGILVVTMGFYTYLLINQNKTLCSAALLLLDVLVFCRILVKDELFGLVKLAAPFFQRYAFNNIVELLTLFLPIVFLICARDLIGLEVKNRILLRIFIFELLCAVPIVFCMMEGAIIMKYFFCLISFFPFVLLLRKLYKNIEADGLYTLIVSTGMLLILSSLIVASQYTSGLLIMNVSMYPSTCFVISVLLQDFMYLRKSEEIRKQALEAANLRLRLQESETALMLSQIKPHFLYNALIAIQVLCTKEPETAETAVINFAKYLRSNMQSIGSREPIPFAQELEHIRNYASIEKLRFKERLNIVYDIGVQEFSVPPLTIQPLVENAIKHGACKKIEGGTVTIKTYETDRHYEILISDDGWGFDTAILNDMDSQSCGLKNISLRLTHLVHAEISIHSEPEKGTDVLIKIPKEGSSYESDYRR